MVDKIKEENSGQKLHNITLQQEKRIFIFFLLGIAFYTSLIFLVDLKKVIGVSYKFNWSIVPLLLLLSFLNYLVRFFRWHYLLGQISIKIPLKTSFRIFMSGLSMTVTPGKVGETIKAYLVKKETGNSFSQMIPLLIFERLTDGIGMIILALGGIYLFRQSILFFILSIAIILAFFVFIKTKNQTLSLIKRIEDKVGHIKILDFFIAFFEHSNLLMKPNILTRSIIFSLIAWFFEGASLFLLVNQFGGFFNLSSLFLSLFIFSFSSIAGFLVLIPGGIGVAEASITSLMTLFYGLGLPEAVFATLLFRFATLWFGVGLGLINLFLSFSKHE